MPWTVEDVAKHNKRAAADSTKAEKWVKIANNALAACEKKGGSDCEGRAIRIANSRVG